MDWVNLLQDGAIIGLAISLILNAVAVRRLQRAERFDRWMLRGLQKMMADRVEPVTGSEAGLSGSDGASSCASTIVRPLRPADLSGPMMWEQRVQTPVDNGSGSTGLVG